MWPPTAPRPLPPSEYRVHKFPEGRVFYCSTAEPEPELLPYCCRLVDATLHRGWDCENTYWGPYVTTSGDKLYRCPSGSKSGDPTPACCEPALYHQVNAELEQCDEQRLIKPLFAEIIPHGIGEAIG